MNLGEQAEPAVHRASDHPVSLLYTAQSLGNSMDSVSNKSSSVLIHWSGIQRKACIAWYVL